MPDETRADNLVKLVRSGHQAQIMMSQDRHCGWLGKFARQVPPNEQAMIDASKYFAAIKWTRPWVRVVETDVVPKTRINGGLFIAIEDKLTEPIDGRIIEVPVNSEEAELKRNPHSSWIAYVPPGSVERGRVLVTTGGAHLDGRTMVEGHTMACGKCHGPALLGMDDAPPIAGRSPSYLARQIYDIQQGARMGPNAAMMRPVVANLTHDDIVDRKSTRLNSSHT